MSQQNADHSLSTFGDLMMRTLIAIALATISSLSYACRCVDQSLDDVLAESSSVFAAQKTSQRVIDDDGVDRIASEFAILKVRRGQPHTIRHIISGTSSSSCWKPVLTGEVYRLYVRKGAEEIYFNRCSRHKHLGPGQVRSQPR